MSHKGSKTFYIIICNKGWKGRLLWSADKVTVALFPFLSKRDSAVSWLKKCWLNKILIECNLYFSRMHLKIFYVVVKFQTLNCGSIWDMNYYLPIVFQWFFWYSRQMECWLEFYLWECSHLTNILTLNQGVFNSICLHMRHCCSLDFNQKKSACLLEEFFLECSWYFSRMSLFALYIVVRFQTTNYNTFRDMNYYVPIIFQSRQTDRQTESDAYEPIVQVAQVGSKMMFEL